MVDCGGWALSAFTVEMFKDPAWLLGNSWHKASTEFTKKTEASQHNI